MNTTNKTQLTESKDINALPGAPAPAETTPQHWPDFLCVDVSFGVKHYDLGPHVYLDERVLKDYMELDSRLGQNVAGVVLSALSCHLAAGRVAPDGGRIVVCLARRNDNRMVEVNLAVRRRGQSGREAFDLCWLAEREFGE